MGDMTQDDVMRATIDHVTRVGELLSKCSNDLVLRGIHHDRSKFSELEWPYFAKYTPLLSATTYGSDEYREGLDSLRPAIEHHGASNRHHPEHFENGVRDMSLLDLLEMLCDWKAASERHKDGNILRSLEVSVERFKIPDELAQVLRNTISYLGLIPQVPLEASGEAEA